MELNIVKEELLDFIKWIKKMDIDEADKHLCDHLKWITEEYYKIFDIITGLDKSQSTDCMIKGDNKNG